MGVAGNIADDSFLFRTQKKNSKFKFISFDSIVVVAFFLLFLIIINVTIFFLFRSFPLLNFFLFPLYIYIYVFFIFVSINCKR